MHPARCVGLLHDVLDIVENVPRVEVNVLLHEVIDDVGEKGEERHRKQIHLLEDGNGSGNIMKDWHIQLQAISHISLFIPLI